MVDRRVTEDQGWSGLLAALAATAPGDRVVVAPGRYRGTETLMLSTGATLEGEPGVVLDYLGDTAAIAAGEVSDVAIRSIELEGYAGLPQPPEDWETAEERAIGLVQMTGTRRVVIEGCTVRALAKRNSCIALSLCDNALTAACILSGAQYGVCYGGTDGAITGCESHAHGQHGILLIHDLRQLSQPADAVIKGNRCHSNAKAGIALVSSLSAAIEDNECWANGAGGIVLQRDPRRYAPPSDAPIRRNRCHHQKGHGINLISSLSAGIENNECWANGAGGIVLDCRTRSRPDKPPSNAPIKCNRLCDCGPRHKRNPA